jgi:hypothetical protein
MPAAYMCSVVSHLDDDLALFGAERGHDISADRDLHRFLIGGCTIKFM